jgi:hypothetical protein
MKNLRDEVLSVLRDGSRIDRYLEFDGEKLYLTCKDVTPGVRQYYVPCADGTAESDEEEWADELLLNATSQLITEVSDAE